MPLLDKIVNLPFGGKSPFSAEVWFVNRAVTLDVNWGTTDPIPVEDPKYNIIVPVRAFGQFGLRIADSRVFLTRFPETIVGLINNKNRPESTPSFFPSELPNRGLTYQPRGCDALPVGVATLGKSFGKILQP